MKQLIQSIYHNVPPTVIFLGSVILVVGGALIKLHSILLENGLGS